MSRKRNTDVKKAMTKWIMHGCRAEVVFDYQTGAKYSLVQLARITDQNIWNRVRPIKEIHVYQNFLKTVQAAVARVFKTENPTTVIFWDDDTDVDSDSSTPPPTEPPWRPILDIPKKLVHSRLCPQNQCRSAGASGQAVPIQRRMLSRPQPCQDPGQLLHRCSAPTSLPRHYRGPSGQHRLQGRQHQHARRPSLHVRASAKHLSELQNTER